MTPGDPGARQAPESFLVVLALPPAELAPGAATPLVRFGRARRARLEAKAAALGAMAGARVPAGAIVGFSAVYVLAPGHRGEGNAGRRFAPGDEIEAAAALGAYRDGIADAIGREGRVFVHGPTEIRRGREATGRPRVEIAVTVIEPGSAVPSLRLPRPEPVAAAGSPSPSCPPERRSEGA